MTRMKFARYAEIKLVIVFIMEVDVVFAVVNSFDDPLSHSVGKYLSIHCFYYYEMVLLSKYNKHRIKFI